MIMMENMEHLHYVALAYLAATVVILFLVLQSLFAAVRVQRALEADAQKDKADAKGDKA